jgi:hypothetical protein
MDHLQRELNPSADDHLRRPDFGTLSLGKAVLPLAMRRGRPCRG